MPSLHKLSVHSNGLQARNSRDLTVVSVPGESQLDLQSTESLMEHGDIFSNLHLLIGKENGKTDALSSSPPPRKRQRLDHLSQEEKIMRRKLKNRVAAQSARDRKKARMNELEEQVVQLETQRKYLLIENAELKSRNAKLEAQNTELKLRLGLVSSDLSEKKNSTNASSGPVTEMVTEEEEEGKSEKGRSLEYASLINGPLLKEQDLQLLTLWMMQYVYLPAIARLMTFLMCFSSVVTSYYNVISLRPSSKDAKVRRLNQPVTKWWGAHQRAWNPSKN